MRKLLILTGIACLLLTGCSKEDAPLPSSGKNELGVSASINQSVSTRSLTGTSFVDGNSIGVFVTGGTAPYTYTPQVATYTYNSAATPSWASGATKIYLSNITATVYAFYPVDLNYGTLKNDDTNTVSFSLSNSESSFTGANQTDCLYASGRTGSVAPYDYSNQPTADYTNTKVDLYFHHVLSKLSFIIKKGQYYTGSGNLTNLTLAPKGASPLFNSGTITVALKDGTLSSSSTSSQIVFTGTTTINDYLAASPSVSVCGLVYPRTDNSGGITLSVTIDGKTMSADMPVASPANQWLPGSNYTYTLTIKGTELIVNSASILPWDEVTGGDITLN